MVQLRDVVDHVMASGGDTRHLVALDVVHERGMCCPLLKIARAGMAMQAFAVVKRVIEADGLLRFAEVLHVDMMQATDFGRDATRIKSVVGVAGIACLVTRNTVVLEVGCGDVRRIVHVQTPPVGPHDVTGQAEPCLLGPFHVILKPQQPSDDGENK